MMMYSSILARSFSKHEQKKLRYGALLGCLLIAFSVATVLKPYLSPLPILKLRLSMGAGLKMLMIDEGRSRSYDNNTTAASASHQKIVENKATHDLLILVNNTTNSHHTLIKEITSKEVKPICNITKITDFCDINQDIRINGSSATVYITAENQQSWTTIKPYPRKGDVAAMNKVKDWSVKPVNDPQNLPQCTQNHSVPAILFSTGGYAGNHFHDFTDLLIPLYITSRHFDGEVQFLITNKETWWINKYQQVLQNLSKYKPIDIDHEKGVQCFRNGIIGLKRHDDQELHIDPSKSTYSMKDFRNFLRSSYFLKKEIAFQIKDNREKKRSQLLIVSRKGSRRFTNIAKIAQLGRRIGYKVVVAEADGNVSRFAETVNSCDVMLGIHGAGLTNIVFLPENAVFIQVVPIGVDWLATTDFEKPAKDMNLRYLEYKIKAEESSLIQQYPSDHKVFRDPASVLRQGWYPYKSLYLEQQNVELDLNRFRAILLKAQKLLQEK